MRLLISLGHPAHFHLFKNVIKILKTHHQIKIVIKKKDVLEELCIKAGYKYENISEVERKNNSLHTMFFNYFSREVKMFKIVKRFNPDILFGSDGILAHVGLLLRIPSLLFGEDDADAIKIFSKTTYPFITKIISPQVCDSGRWNYKRIVYNGYHEIAYLGQAYFVAAQSTVLKYFQSNEKYFLIRVSKLQAHHDRGESGFSDNLLKRVINILLPYGRILISSERTLKEELQQYCLKIDPIDMHDLISFSELVICDSQTMSAEAAVLGTPSIRYSSFVGRLSYLEELENEYGLTFGFNTDRTDEMLLKICQLLKRHDLKEEWQKRREKMLSDKIDVTAFIIWLISNYPKSISILEKDPDYQFNYQANS